MAGNSELTPDLIRTIKKNREKILSMNCKDLLEFLDQEWDNLRNVDQFNLIKLMFKENHCAKQLLIPYLYKLLKDPDPLYRYHTMNHISELEGPNSEEMLKKIICTDSDEDNRKRSLILLSTIFANQKDREILKLALSIFNNPINTTGMRLVAGAAMMFQIGIENDQNGKPAWWNECDEELDHPLLQKAINDTRMILQNIPDQ